VARRISIYPLYGLAGQPEDEPFNEAVLPFEVIPNVTLELVSPLFSDETWDWLQSYVGKRSLDDLKGVRHAIVHRYETEQEAVNLGAHSDSRKLIQNIAALLRLIRPMTQRALLIQGEFRRDDTLDVKTFDHPIDLEVPEVQKLFCVSNRDADALRELAPEFLRAMAGEFWKFRIAVQFHDAGHFHGALFWKARYMLWCSGLESIYTSQDREHSGSNVARERIKWFLGANTPLYPLGDIPSFCPQSDLTVGQIVKELYDLRNYVAHGDKTPDEFFQKKVRRGLNGDLNLVQVCLECVSFILRHSLLKILQERLLENFANSPVAEKYFENAGLTNTLIRQREMRQARPHP
jgi:hypothetical protein